MKVFPIVVGELGTNCYIVSSSQRRAFVIDPGDDADKVRRCLKDNGLEARFIVNTHGHIDHIKADVALGLPVYIHEEDRDMVSDPARNMMTVFFGTFEPVVPERLLRDGDDVTLDELTFSVIHTPGHTRGSVCLLGHGVLFSGDTLFRNGVGRTDYPGASARKIEESLERLAGLAAETIVYPGHGPQTTIGRELG
jgi:glyoxylase-like metal-dependent hydrolase (beta-lactamase superfamily II)